MVMKIDGQTVEVTWEDNAAVAKLKELAADGLTIQMSMMRPAKRHSGMPTCSDRNIIT